MLTYGQIIYRPEDKSLWRFIGYGRHLKEFRLVGTNAEIQTVEDKDDFIAVCDEFGDIITELSNRVCGLGLIDPSILMNYLNMTKDEREIGRQIIMKPFIEKLLNDAKSISEGMSEASERIHADPAISNYSRSKYFWPEVQKRADRFFHLYGCYFFYVFDNKLFVQEAHLHHVLHLVPKSKYNKLNIAAGNLSICLSELS